MFRIITLIALLLTLCVVVGGAYVRLSDAGLGCPDWPGCYGQLVPPQSSDALDKANNAFPGLVVETAKAWKEMGHRYMAATLGGLVLLLWLMAWWRQQRKWSAVTQSTLLLLLIVFQALLGMLTVTSKVMPPIVLGHLLAGLATLVLLQWLYLDSQRKLIDGPRYNGLKWWANGALLVLIVQIILGGWTSTNYAALACPDFPTCLGEWWPPADGYRKIFADVYELGIDYQGGVLEPEVRAVIHWLHRLGSVVTVVVLLPLSLWLMVAKRYQRRLRWAGGLLLLLLLTQIVAGIGNVVLRMPLVVAMAHHILAALLLMVLVYIRFYSVSSLLLRRVAVEEVPTDKQLTDIEWQADREVTVIDRPSPEREEVPAEATPETLFLRLKHQLQKTRGGVVGALATLPLGKRAIDQELLEEIEASLIMADIGIDATNEIIEQLTLSVERHQLSDGAALTAALRAQMLSILQPCSQPLMIECDSGPFVILVVGVNGVGKTTTIGKLAKRLQGQGHSVMLAAGDTFRAAAVEQLQVWGERNDIAVVAQHTGADSASVIYDAIESAKSRGIDVLIADTAGRLHTKSNLMEELKKVKRIIGKLDASAPHEVLLVLDSGTGQNAVVQTEQFNNTVEVSGIALTKLDGTAKGGVIIALAKKFGIPVRFIGIGEGIDDLQPFDAERFIDALFDMESEP